MARPNATFDGHDLYPTALDKAAGVFESVIINHPFIDGNKRTAYTLIRLMLIEQGYDISSSEDEKYDMTIAASKGQLKFDEIVIWLTENTRIVL